MVPIAVQLSTTGSNCSNLAYRFATTCYGAYEGQISLETSYFALVYSIYYVVVVVVVVVLVYSRPFT